VTFGLAVASQDVGRAKEALDAQWRDLLEEGQGGSADIILDHTKDEMTCPACLTTFPTGPEECPDCGLYIGVG
jgi:hypothetical protein